MCLPPPPPPCVSVIYIKGRMRGNLIGIACEKRVVGTERAKTLDRDFQGKSLLSSPLRRDKDEVEPAVKSAKLPSCEVTG